MKTNKKLFITGAILLLVGISIGLIIASKFDFQIKGYSEDYQISREAQETSLKNRKCNGRGCAGCEAFCCKYLYHKKD